jgi:lipopolysaccharide/colanic/teichoic acid biosynthesis glycosyltransferase
MKECKVQRFFDLTFSIVCLIILSPFLLFVALILAITGEGEVLYIQKRIGMGGHEFNLIKFATMLKNSNQMLTGDITLSHDPRVLKFGRILRLTKINELPQLINVVFGDMSFIGPRPLTRSTFEAYPMEIKNLIKSVRPGLSGIGSIVFRKEDAMLSLNLDPLYFYKEIIAPYKGRLERWYIENNSLKIYFISIFLTIYVIVIPSTKIIWSIFKTIPRPPKELNKFISTE